MSVQTTTDFDIFLKSSREYVTTFLRDPRTNDLTDVVGTSTFSLIKITDDTTTDSGSFTATGGAKVSHPSTGTYQYEFDSATYNSEYIASFRCILAGDVIRNNVFVKTVTSRYFKYASALRAQVDKARKSISDDIENMDRSNFEPAVKFFYGYDDKYLIYYLERGTQIINAVPPYTSFTVDTFPFDQYGSILIDAATIAALESQAILSIDTDYNYSLGGNSLVIDHYTKLSGFVSSLITRFDKSLVSFKQMFRSKGMVMFQWMPGGVRSARMLSSLPSGFWSRMLSNAYV